MRCVFATRRIWGATAASSVSFTRRLSTTGEKHTNSEAPPAAGGSEGQPNGTSPTSAADGGGDRSGVTVRTSQGFIEPSDDVVMEYARGALGRDGRDQEPKAEIYHEDTTTYPILARGRKNYFDHTDDIPKHVNPYYDHHWLQSREYFTYMRERKPFLQRMKPYFAVFFGCAAIYGFVTVTTVWFEQPNDVKLLRGEILQNSYGRVCELGAGHGMNIGCYPYPVHEIVMTDNNKTQLQHLRYRIPKTAYPKYDVRLVDSEQMTCFKDGEFDCVIDMFGLCHLRDPVMALRQMQRIVKPTGIILLLEHGRSRFPWVNWFLDYYADKHDVNTHGCKWNLPVMDYIKESHLQVKEVRNMHYGTTYYIVAFPEVLPGSTNVTPQSPDGAVLATN